MENNLPGQQSGEIKQIVPGVSKETAQQNTSIANNMEKLVELTKENVEKEKEGSSVDVLTKGLSGTQSGKSQKSPLAKLSETLSTLKDTIRQSIAVQAAFSMGKALSQGAINKALNSKTGSIASALKKPVEEASKSDDSPAGGGTVKTDKGPVIVTVDSQLLTNMAMVSGAIKTIADNINAATIKPESINNAVSGLDAMVNGIAGMSKSFPELSKILYNDKWFPDEIDDSSTDVSDDKTPKIKTSRKIGILEKVQGAFESYGEIVNTIAGMEKNINKAGPTMSKLYGMNIGTALARMMEQFNTKEFLDIFDKNERSENLMANSRYFGKMATIEKTFAGRSDPESMALKAKAESSAIDELNDFEARTPLGKLAATVGDISEIFDGISSIEKIGIKSIFRLKAAQRLGVGRTLSKFMRDLNKDIKFEDIKDINGSIDAISKINPAIIGFADTFHKSMAKVAMLKVFNPGKRLAGMFNMFKMDFSGSKFAWVRKEYGSMSDMQQVAAINKQLLFLDNDSTMSPVEKSDKKLELIESKSKIRSTKSTAEMFSIVFASQTKTITDMMGVMSGLKESSMNAVKSVSFALPAVKVATMGFKSISRSIFGMIKDVAKIIELNGKKRTGQSFFKKISTKLFHGLSSAPQEQEQATDKKSYIAEEATILGSIVQIINTMTYVNHVGLRKTALAFLIVSKMNFGKNATKVAEGMLAFYMSFKNVKINQAKNFKENVKHLFEGVSNSIKSLAKSAILVRPAAFAIKRFGGLVDSLKEVIEKIEKIKTEGSVAKKGAEFLAVVSLIKSLKGIAKAIFELTLITPLLPIALVGMAFITGVVSFMHRLGSAKEIVATAKSAYVLQVMSKGLFMFGVGMAAMGLLVTASIPTIMIGLGLLYLTTKLFDRLAKRTEHQKIKDGSHAIIAMSKALLAFSLSMFFFSKLMKATSKDTIIGLGILGISAGLFFLLGKGHKQIGKGAKAILWMSLALVAFSVGIGILSMVMKVVNPLSAVLGIGLVALTGAIFYIIGKGITEVAKGGLAVIVMGIALAAFGFGLGYLADVIGQKSLTDMLIGAGVLAGFAVGFLAAGTGAILIASGAGAIILMSVALWAFGAAFKSLLDTGIQKVPVEDLGKVALSIGGLATVFGAIGLPLVAPFVVIGAATVAAMGAGLYAVSAGMKEALTVDWQKVPIDNIKSVLVGLGEAFAAVGREGSKDTGLAGSFLNPLTWVGLGPNNVKKGINSVLDASQALTSVAMGLRMFDTLTKDLDLRTKIDPKTGLPIPEEGSLFQKISVSLMMVNKAFSDIGASGNSGFSLVKAVFGADLKQSDAKVGINSVMDAGKALLSVATGLQTFEKMTKGFDFSTEKGQDGTDKPKQGSLPFKIATTLGIINKVFSDIGYSGNNSVSLTKALFGNDFKQTDTKVGIDSVMDAGKALSGIAEGLKKFEEGTKGVNWDASKDVVGTDGKVVNPTSMTGKITMVVGMISKIFSEIGGTAKGGGTGVMGFLGFDTSKTDVQKGIEAVKGVGTELVAIADAVKKWGDLDKEKINITQIKDNISLILGVVSDVFADIGKKDDSGWFSKGDVSKGVNAVKGLGGELKEIGDGLKPYMDMQKDENGKKMVDIDKVKTNLASMLSLSTDLFAALGGSNDAQNRIYNDTKVRITYIGADVIENVVNILKKAAEGLKVVENINDIAGKVDEKKWDRIKNIIPNMAMMPVNIITQMAKVFETVNQTQVELLIDKVLPSIVTRINQVVEAQMKLSQGLIGKGGQSPIATLGSDMQSFLINISKPPSEQILNRVNTTVSFIERLSNTASNMKTFTEYFSKYVKDTKELINSINNIQIPKIEDYVKLQQTVQYIVQTSQTQVKGNLDAILGYLGQQAQIIKDLNVAGTPLDPTMKPEDRVNALKAKSVTELSQVELLQLLAIQTSETNNILNNNKLNVRMA